MNSVEFKRLWKETQVVVGFVIICVIVGVAINCFLAVSLGLFMLTMIGIALICSKLIDIIVEKKIKEKLG